MDNYIRDFKCKKIETETISSIKECNEVFKINRFTSNFTFMHCNIRSIQKNLDELKISLTQMENPFDCIILTETHRIENLSLYQLEGYSVIYNNGSLNQNDGVLVYLRQNINHDFKIVLFHEISLIELEITYLETKILILAIYRSPSSGTMQFNNDLYQYLQTSKQYFDYNILVGDINIDILKRSDYSHQYLDILSEYLVSFLP